MLKFDLGIPRYGFGVCPSGSLQEIRALTGTWKQMLPAQPQVRARQGPESPLQQPTSRDWTPDPCTRGDGRCTGSQTTTSVVAPVAAADNKSRGIKEKRPAFTSGLVQVRGLASGVLQAGGCPPNSHMEMARWLWEAGIWGVLRSWGGALMRSASS